MNMNKTLIGKNNYLFLQNDSGKELEIHNNNLNIVSDDFYKKYQDIKDKFLIVIFPNKSYIYSQFLPDGYNMIYRPAFDLYKKYFKEHIIDGYLHLKDLDDTYYKTDTHINNKGALIIYNEFINKINTLFNLNIISQTYTYNKINIENVSCTTFGDLTWNYNLGDQILESRNDTYYKINESEEIYFNYVFHQNSDIKTFLIEDNLLIDKTNDNINKTLVWDIFSEYILFKKNQNVGNNYKVLIFHDSFLCTTLQLYMNLFQEVYTSKSIFDVDIINCIKPDYIFEFRCERFLL